MPACRTGLWDRWRPAALVTSDIIVLKLLLGVFAIVRAEDYAHGVADRYGVLESAMPLWVWSAWAYVVGACILIGIAWQRHTLVWIGHSAGAAVYSLLTLAQVSAAFHAWPPVGDARQIIPIDVWTVMCGALGIALIVGAVTATGPLRFAAWAASAFGLLLSAVTVALAGVPADGLRSAGPLAIVALLHTFFALRSGPRPLGDDEAHVVEATTAPEGR